MSASERGNEVIVGQVEDGRMQTVRVAVYDYLGKPYISIGIHRVEGDGGVFVRGLTLRQDLWAGLAPFLAEAVELAKVRELAGLEREAYGDCLPVERGWRRPR
jgi:hypothetical protein